jgi:antitoxin ParD1/3/4
MNVTLTPELEKFIADRVGPGQFSTASELIWHALTLLEQQEKTREGRVEEFNRELKARIDSLDRGEHVTAEQFEPEMREKSVRRRAELSSSQRHS